MCVYVCVYVYVCVCMCVCICVCMYVCVCHTKCDKIGHLVWTVLETDKWSNDGRSG